MSIHALRQLRTSGKAPNCVWLIAGSAPKSLMPSPDVVVWKRGDDLRPLYRLRVDVFAQDDETLDEVLDRLEKVDALVIGISGPAGSVGINEAHEIVLDRVKELLCRY